MNQIKTKIAIWFGAIMRSQRL